MLCSDVNNCFDEIKAYYNTDKGGYPFIVNADDGPSLQYIISQMQADSRKTIIRLSDYCSGDALPNVDAAISAAAADGDLFVLGLSAYYMLQSEKVLKKEVSELAELSVKDHTVIVLYGCGNILKNLMNNDLRLGRRVAILQGAAENTPKIVLAKSEKECAGKNICYGFKELLRTLEDLSFSDGSGEINVITHFNPTMFKSSMFFISECGNTFSILSKKYREISSSAEESWGTDSQWKALSDMMDKYGSLSSVIDTVIGSTTNLSSFIDEKFDDPKSIDAWYLWIAMKVFGTKENGYLSIAVKKSGSAAELAELIYMELLCHKHTEPDFQKLYKERKRLIERLPEEPALIQKYCDHVGQYEKDAVYYLTDSSYKEKLKFLRCVSCYEYTADELLDVCDFAFPELFRYLSDFEFTEFNTKIPSNDTSLYSELTSYFNEYKLQKVSNRIFPEFLKRVNENAVTRPYTKLLPRISIVNDIDKSKAQIHFFDALGVEYLAYIIYKCDKYDMQPIVHVAHCELPSITKQNIEFKRFFKTSFDANGNEVIPGTKELDELKHHSREIDYTKCKEPIHLFIELEIIDKELRKIKEMLVSGEFEKVIIISDHGASRLAVLNQSESELYKLENHAEHSGRCCETKEIPNIPEAAYENGYAVLANYDRFKGSRLANVEVHGGASLEETVVPIIEVSLKPEKSEIYFVNDYIEFHNKDVVSVTVYSNIVISEPKIIIRQFDGKIYSCGGSVDGKHYKFEIPDIKRSGKYTAALYDGSKLLMQNMIFEVKKAISTTKDFF